MHLISPRIESSRNSLDVASLPCRVPALIGDDHRYLLAVKLVMQMVQFLLKSAELLPIRFLRHRLVLQGNVRKLWHLLQREWVLQNWSRQCLIFQRRVNALIQESQNLKLRPFLVLRVDDIPGRDRTVGILQKAVIHLQAFSVISVLLPILTVYAPAGILVRRECLQPFLLLLPADLEEKLQNQISIVVKRPLRRVDAVNFLLVLLFAHFSGHHPVCDFLQPVGIKKSKFSRLRDLEQIPIEERIPFLIGSRRRKIFDLEKPGINVPDHLADHAPLSGGTPALKNHHDRKLCLLDLQLIAGKLLPRRFKFLFDLLPLRRNRLHEIL